MTSSIEAIQRQKKRPEKDSPVMYQHWEELLFLHWAVDREALQSKLPKGLHLDTYNGVAYVGVVPFLCSISAHGFYLQYLGSLISWNSMSEHM